MYRTAANQIKPIFQPELLKDDLLWRPTEVFLCGPGIGNAKFDLREKSKEILETVRSTKVYYGEDIDIRKMPRRERADLQTLEARFAHSVDLTILLLGSPGSIAELGTFSMIRNLRPRLYVLVPRQFYRAESYISRGPLSLIARQNLPNIIYVDEADPRQVGAQVRSLITFYKYAHGTLGWQYSDHLKNAPRRRNYSQNAYESFIASTRQEFECALTLLAIIIYDNPNFAELLRYTSLGPQRLSASLHRLYSTNSIKKMRQGRYHSVLKYSDPALSNFDTTRVSQLKAREIAA